MEFQAYLIYRVSVRTGRTRYKNPALRSQYIHTFMHTALEDEKVAQWVKALTSMKN